MIDGQMEHRMPEMAGKMLEDGPSRSIPKKEGPEAASGIDGPVGKPEGSALKAKCTASTLGSVLRSPRRDSVLVMELR